MCVTESLPYLVRNNMKLAHIFDDRTTLNSWFLYEPVSMDRRWAAGGRVRLSSRRAARRARRLRRLGWAPKLTSASFPPLMPAPTARDLRGPVSLFVPRPAGCPSKLADSGGRGMPESDLRCLGYAECMRLPISSPRGGGAKMTEATQTTFSRDFFGKEISIIIISPVLSVVVE